MLTILNLLLMLILLQVIVIWKKAMKVIKWRVMVLIWAKKYKLIILGWDISRKPKLNQVSHQLCHFPISFHKMTMIQLLKSNKRNHSSNKIIMMTMIIKMRIKCHRRVMTKMKMVIIRYPVVVKEDLAYLIDPLKINNEVHFNFYWKFL